MRRLYAVLVVMLAFGQHARASVEDDRVSAALRASLLGDASAVRAIARQQRLADQKPTLAENLELLATATELPAPDLRTLKSNLSDYSGDGATKAADRLTRRNEPRQRFREAASDRRYESRRAAFNALGAPLAGLAQGQFFPLFALPFDFAEVVFVGRPFATPEERKELRTARDLAADLPQDPLSAKALDRSESLTPKRRRLAELQARFNGDRAREEDRPEAARFWYERELALRELTEPVASGHRELLIREARREAARREAVVVVDGESGMTSPAEVRVYTESLRAFLAGNREAFQSASRRLTVEYPSSVTLGSSSAAEAAVAREDGDVGLAAVLLVNLEGTDSSWADRAKALLRSTEFDPEPRLDGAGSMATKRRTQYVWDGRDPQIVERGLTPDEARLRRGSAVSRARAFFVTDALARFLFLPFTDPVPRPELLDALASTSPDWLSDPAHREWVRKWASALGKARRHEDAATVWESYGEPSRAARSRHRAAARMEKLGDQMEPAQRRVDIYTRLLNAYPVYKRRTRVEASLDDARRNAMARATISREELRLWPELLAALAMGDAMADRKRGNGEATDAGILILRGGLVAWKDRRSRKWIETPLEEERSETALRMLEPRRRLDAVRQETSRPLSRKKIPLALEAGVYPGFEVYPGLVPLEPDAEDRSLYE